MKTYNSNDYTYILKGSEVQIQLGVEYTKNIEMPDKFAFCDNLMYQLGVAIQEGDKPSIDNLYEVCVNLAKDLLKYASY